MEAAAGGESGAVNVDNDGQPDMVMTMEFQQPQTYPEARATHEQVQYRVGVVLVAVVRNKGCICQSNCLVGRGRQPCCA